ncbi:DUF7218 family protein, partial [Kribbella pittospori]|uniref:DUF7218 family protein n=1 Tax=Kribbella pittospori TaxID=722689 RepID=UPI003B50D55D
MAGRRGSDRPANTTRRRISRRNATVSPDSSCCSTARKGNPLRIPRSRRTPGCASRGIREGQRPMPSQLGSEHRSLRQPVHPPSLLQGNELRSLRAHRSDDRPLPPQPSVREPTPDIPRHDAPTTTGGKRFDEPKHGESLHGGYRRHDGRHLVEVLMPGKSSKVKNEKQYEALKDKGMSKQRAAKIANSSKSSEHGGKSGKGGNSS